MKKLFLITFAAVFFTAGLLIYAQQYEDVVYLKNGSIIHGTIVEQVPNESLKIKTKDGSVFVYKTEEVSKITKEQITEGEETEISQKTKPNMGKLFFGFYAGLNFASGTSDPSQTKPGPDRFTAFLVGAMVEREWNKNLASQIAIHYIQKGVDNAELYGYYPSKVRLSYLDFQIVIKGKLGLGGFNPYALFAPTIGIKLSSTAEFQGVSGDMKDVSGTNLGIDFGAGSDFAVSKNTGLFIELRYEWGVSNLNSSSTNNTSVFSNGIKLLGGLKFGL